MKLKKPIREDVLDLSDRLMECLNGEDASVGISALMTTMLEVLLDVSESKAQLIKNVNGIQDSFNARHAAEAWDMSMSDIN